MSDDVSRVHGPSADGPRYTWKPRFESSDPVRHSRRTEPSPGTAENDIRRTAVVPPNPKAPMSQGTERTLPARSFVNVAERFAPDEPHSAAEVPVKRRFSVPLPTFRK